MKSKPNKTDKRKSFRVHICPGEGLAMPERFGGHRIGAKSELSQDLRDCTGPGDCEDACRHVLEHYRPEFWLLRHVGYELDKQTYRYEWQQANMSDLVNTCKEIGFESSGENEELFLVWKAAFSFVDDAKE